MSITLVMSMLFGLSKNVTLICDNGSHSDFEEFSCTMKFTKKSHAIVITSVSAKIYS